MVSKIEKPVSKKPKIQMPEEAEEDQSTVERRWCKLVYYLQKKKCASEVCLQFSRF